MEQSPKEIRIRIEAPQPSLAEPLIQKQGMKALSKFYYLLLFLTFVFSGLGLYFSFFTR